MPEPLEPVEGAEVSEGAEPVVEATPEHWTPDDDSLFMPPGSEEGAAPVRWADYSAGMVSKADFTKMRQEDAATLEAHRVQLNQSYQQAYANAVAQNTQKAPAGPSPQEQRQGEINALLDRADAEGGGLVNTAIVKELVTRFNSALAARDQDLSSIKEAMRLVYGNQQEGAKSVSQLVKASEGSRLEAKMTELFSTHGIPDESRDVAAKMVKDIYNSYEPGTIDLDNDLPRMFEERWLALKKAFHQISKADGERGKKIPGKGGDAIPSLPLSNSGMTERELAEQAWQAIQEAPAT